MFRFPFTFLLELLKDVRELKRCEKLVRGMKIQREKKKRFSVRSVPAIQQSMQIEQIFFSVFFFLCCFPLNVPFKNEALTGFDISLRKMEGNENVF